MGALPWSVGATVLTYTYTTVAAGARWIPHHPRDTYTTATAVTTREVEGHTSQVLADKALLHLSSPTGSIPFRSSAHLARPALACICTGSLDERTTVKAQNTLQRVDTLPSASRRHLASRFRDTATNMHSKQTLAAFT